MHNGTALDQSCMYLLWKFLNMSDKSFTLELMIITCINKTGVSEQTGGMLNDKWFPSLWIFVEHMVNKRAVSDVSS